MNYAKAVRIARSIAGHSQRDLATRADIDPSLISLIESGSRQPSTLTLEKISKALDMPLHLLTMLGAESADLRGITAEEFHNLSEAIARLLLRDDGEPVQYSRGRGSTR